MARRTGDARARLTGAARVLFGFPWHFFAELAGLGAIGGLLAGLLGVGGGMILVPFTTLLLEARGVPGTLTLKMAVGTSLATICFTALSSVRAHRARGAVRGDVVVGLAPGIVVGAMAGAQLAKALPPAALGAAFGVFLLFAATQMLFELRPAPAHGLPGRWAMAGVGGTIGLLSALVGAGGAFLSVPFMVWRNVTMHQAVGTASALGLPIALAGAFGFVVAGWSAPGLPAGALGFVYLPALAALAGASIVTAPFGAALAHRLNVRQLRRIFAFMLYAVGLAMLSRGASG